MNLRQKGSRRDRALVQAIEEHRALDTDQVQALMFAGLKPEAGQRKAQERLLKLCQRGKVARSSMGEGPYCYYVGDKPGMLAHLLGVNWVRLWMLAGCKSWERLHSFGYEQDYGVLRCDGFAAVKNTVTGRYRFAFVEMDRGTNEFNKVRLYNRLYEREGYTGRWWVPLAGRFPPVVVATSTPRRAEVIRARLAEENSAGLEFNVMLLEDIKREVMQRCGS